MKTTRLSSFSCLVKYITNPQDKQERVGKISLANCNSVDPLWAIQEVLATQAKNQRATADKTYHLLISFAVGETLPDTLLNVMKTGLCLLLALEITKESAQSIMTRIIFTSMSPSIKFTPKPSR